jgi:hypothetical protein
MTPHAVLNSNLSKRRWPLSGTQDRFVVFNEGRKSRDLSLSITTLVHLTFEYTVQ